MFDAGVALTYFIQSDQVKNNITSTLIFDITQFFLLLSHCLLPLILRKTEFDSKVDLFFSNYLVGRKTQYFWNNFSSLFFNIDVGVGQDSALSFILSTLYLASILHIFKKNLKIFKILVFILSFVDNGLLVAQSKSLTISNSFVGIILLLLFQRTRSHNGIWKDGGVPFFQVT